jgi:hypothetical protein
VLLLPVLLPLPLLPLELPEPMLPLAPLLGEVVALPPPLLLELDLLKCASHSEREIWPSLFESTDEKLGVAVLALAALPPEALDDALGRLDEPVEELPAPALLGEEVLDEPEAAGEDDELCAAATPDSANSAAAVAMLTNFRFNIGWISLGEVGEKLQPSLMQDTCPDLSLPARRLLSRSDATTRASSDSRSRAWRPGRGRSKAG